MVMYGLGAWAILPLGWLWSLLYIIYVLASNLLFMLVACSCCLNFGKRSCGSGYGLLAAKISRRGSGEPFPSRFRACLPFLALSWVIPVAGGALAIYRDIVNGRIAMEVIVPVALFSAVAFGVLPFTSKRECRTCAMRERCPGASLTREGRNETG
jgi:hypothetical protein